MRSSMTLMGCVCAVTVAAVTAGAQDADFGDLPDPTYPTLRASGGPYHLDVTHEWIGLPPNSTTVEPDAMVVDMDIDDGFTFVNLVNIHLNGQFSMMGQVRVPVSTDGDTAIRYLNVVADLNNDGQFASYPSGALQQFEWLACNVPVLHLNTTKTIVSTFTLLAPILGAPPVRATLSTEPIAPNDFGTSGWDGSGPAGGFARGETEDYMSVPAHNVFRDGFTGILFSPPMIPVQPWQPWNPPVSSRRVVDGPAGGGNPPVFPPPKKPAGPLNFPVTTSPLRFDDGQPVQPAREDVGYPYIDMPDIKQGPNECAPTAAANSLRYLMDKNELTPPGDDDAINRGLQEGLKAAMGTTAQGGTEIAPDDPEHCNFRKGKKNANLPAGVKEKLVTQGWSNPSMKDICDAVKKGADVEIVIASYENGQAPERKPQGHMVNVIGCIQRPDGTMELKFLNPDDIDPNLGEGPGTTVFPPREHSIIVKNNTSDPERGGLEVVGEIKNKEGVEVKRYIEMVFVETLGEENDNIKPEVSSDNPDPDLGEEVRLSAQVPGKADDYLYLWIKDGENMPFETESSLYFPALTEDMLGFYECFVYDGDQFFATSLPFELTVSEEEEQVPAGGALGLAMLSTALAFAAARGLCKRG